MLFTGRQGHELAVWIIASAADRTAIARLLLLLQLHQFLLEVLKLVNPQRFTIQSRQSNVFADVRSIILFDILQDPSSDLLFEDQVKPACRLWGSLQDYR